MANSRENYSLSEDYTILWVHPKMPKRNTWSGSHDFDLCIKSIIKSMVKQQNIEAYDFDVEGDPAATSKEIIAKIKEIRPNLIMFFDEFSQWNTAILHAIRKDKEITERSYQILSYPTLSLVFSNFTRRKI